MNSRKIRVAHHSKTIGYAGTDRVAQLFCKYLQMREEETGIEPYLLYQSGGAKERLDIVRDILGPDRVVEYDLVHADKPRPPYNPKSTNLSEVLAKLDVDIFHIHRSGYPEFPGMKEVVPTGCKIVETNIFGYADLTGNIDAHLYISDYIRQSALRSGNPEGAVLYNPVEIRQYRNHGEDAMPIEAARPAARKELLNWIRTGYGYDIPEDAVVLGRVGRADNFDPISLRAFAAVNDPNAWYIVVNGCDQWRKHAKELGINNIVFHDPIYDDLELSRFYSAIDIYAHARHDGECCPCNIQEAMMHAAPVVSHVSQIHNGQIEILADSGFVVQIGDVAGYAEVLRSLINSPELRTEYGRLGLRRAMRNFEASSITNGLIAAYKWVMENA